MSLRTHLASNGDGRENAIVELPECREYLELQRRVFANAYFSKQKVKVRRKKQRINGDIPSPKWQNGDVFQHSLSWGPLILTIRTLFEFFFRDLHSDNFFLKFEWQ